MDDKYTMSYRGSFIIFLHIQKTGGMTIQRMLRRRYGKSFIHRAVKLIMGEAETSNKLEDAMKKTRMDDKYFAGHFCFGAHRYLPKPSTYICMLREPVSRLISLWHHSRKYTSSYYYSHAIRFSLEDFLLKCELMELDNGMTRFIAGDDNDLFINRTPIGQCDNKLLEKAKHNIDEYFSFIGLVERFDESVLLLANVLDWKNAFYLRRNISTHVKNNELTPDLLEKVRSKNFLDIQLYDYARQRFERDMNGACIDMHKLDEFRKINSVYSGLLLPPYELYDSFKALAKGQWGRPR